MSSDFMRQFMAGWGMGQQKLQNQRMAEQEAYNRQQDALKQQAEAEDRAIRMETYKMQQQEARLKLKQEQIAAAQQEAAMKREAAARQMMPAPTAQDMGIQQTTPQDVGPSLDQIQMNRPMDMMPSPTGGADIGIPQLTAREEQERQQQADIQSGKAIQFPNDPSIPEMFRGRTVPRTPVVEAFLKRFIEGPRLEKVDLGDRIEFVDPTQMQPGAVLTKRPAPRAPGEAPEPGTMNPKQEANFKHVTTRFQSDKAIENANNSRVAIELANQVIADPGNAPNQLMTVYSLIKNLDQGSAVREGETALLQSTLSYVSRYQNAFDRLTKNQLLPPETAKEFAEATKRLAEQWVKVGDRKVRGYRAQAKGLNIGDAFDMYLTEAGIQGPEIPTNPSGGAKRGSGTATDPYVF